jgi:hypothetical protein
MAQGAVAPVSSNGTMTLTAEEIHEILECEKIVRFRDAVLLGTHPRIKVPPHLNGKSATRHTSTPTSLTPRPNLPSSQVEPKAIIPGTHVEDNHSLSNNRSSIMPRMAPGRSGGAVPMLAKAEINPILLEKSDDLIKAEIQLQRVRLERALREQVEQRRLSLKASAQTSESLPDFDISEVLSKALAIVHPSAATVAEQPVGDNTSASDSFDENTFYSSQHDTPEQSISSQELRERGETSARVIAMTATHSVNSIMNKDHYEPSNEVITDVSLSKNVPSAEQELAHQPSPMLQHPKLGASYLTSSPGLKMTATDTAPQGQTDGAYDEDIARAAGGSVHPVQEATVSTYSNMISERSSKALEYRTDFSTAQTGASLKRKFAETDSSTSAEIPEPAIIRNLEDVPTLAPQPARVSPLATARAPPVIGQSMIADEATPAQVTALRKPSAASSPESSPKENKASDKKKSKKKKRKSSGKQPGTADAPDSPYIKPEPRSPSPFAVAPLPRPLQRQRQTVPQGPELNYDEPRYEVPREEPRELAVNSRYKDHRPRSVHDRTDDERLYEPPEAELYGYQRVGRDGKQYNRVVSQEVYRAPTSPMMSAGPYSSHEPRTIRAASHAITDRYGQEALRYAKDIPPRATIRLHADRERSRSPTMRDRRSPVLMAPPRLPAARIVVDEYGQQYYAPAPVPVSSRRSVAPANRHGDEDLIYERTSVRPIARTVPDLYDEDRVIYRRPSPPLTTPRRVISEADPDVDYRSYRQREYSSRPVVLAPPSEEYVRIREPLETRQSDYALEAPAGYASLGYAPRARSVRPEVLRDDAPREYVARVQSVRPELPPKDYPSGVRPENTRGEGPPREYATRLQSVRPEALHQDYSPAIIRREPIREGAPREYVTRVQSVRPEKIPQQYAGNARHEPRREISGQQLREFSVRPGDTEIVRREYMPPAESGYAPTTRLVSRRVIDEADYMERPRDGTHDVYVDDSRRDVMYR